MKILKLLAAGVLVVASLVVLPAQSAQAVESECMGQWANIVGTDGNDRIYGTSGDDVITGGQGQDLIFGMGGNDVICGGQGDDNIFGQGGYDFANGGGGWDNCAVEEGWKCEG